VVIEKLRRCNWSEFQQYLIQAGDWSMRTEICKLLILLWTGKNCLRSKLVTHYKSDTPDCSCYCYSIQVGGGSMYSEIHKLINCIRNKEELPYESKLVIRQKGDIPDCAYYKSISLLSTAHNIWSTFISHGELPYVNEIIGDHHCQFLWNRSTTDCVVLIFQILDNNGSTVGQCIS